MERASARALAFLALFAAAPALAAEPPKAEQAIEAQRSQLLDATGLAPCPTGPGEEIVVCGRRGDDRERHVFEPVPGERRRLLPGEPPSARAALSATALPSCTTVGPNQRCGGGLPVIETIFLLAKIAKHVVDPDE